MSSFINFRYVNGFPKLGAQNAYCGSPLRVPSSTAGFYGYHFLLVINRPEAVSWTVSEIAFDMFNIAIFGYPFLRLTPDRAVPLGRSP